MVEMYYIPESTNEGRWKVGEGCSRMCDPPIVASGPKEERPNENIFAFSPEFMYL